MQLKTQATGPGIGALDARYVNITGDAMTGTLSISPTTDVAPLVLKAGGTSTSIYSLNIQDSAGNAWFTVRKRLLSDSNTGFNLDFQTSGTTGTPRTGMNITMNSGYTGGEFTSALGFDSAVAGTAAYYLADASVYGYRPGGNRGIGGFSRGVTTGHNVGGMFIAGGGAVNYGVWGAATVTKSGGSNVGVIGVAANASVTNPGAIGVYATLYNTSTVPPNMANIKTALLVDNQAFTDPIAIFRSNGGIIASIEDAGDFLLGDRTSTTNLGTRFRVPATITTTDATVTTLESYATASDTSYTVHCTVTAVKSDGSVTGSFVFYAALKNDSGTLTLVDGPNYAQNYGGGVGLVATIDVSGTSFRVRVTGVAASNYRWQNQFRICAAKY